MDSGSLTIVAIAAIAIILTILFCLIPPFIAYRRRHRNRVAILALSLLLGWTFLGWVAALVWSLMNDPQPMTAASISSSPNEQEQPVPTVEEKPVLSSPISSSRLPSSGLLIVIVAAMVFVGLAFVRLEAFSTSIVAVSPTAPIFEGGEALAAPARQKQDHIIKQVFEKCTLRELLPVNFDGQNPMSLEHRICPIGFYRSENDISLGSLSAPAGVQQEEVSHQILIVYSNHWWGRRIEAGFWSEMDSSFDPPTSTKTSEGYDAVLWSGGEICGSCLGVQGVLGWSPSKGSIVWDLGSVSLNQYLKPGETAEDGSLAFYDDGISYTARVSEDGEPHCCPTGGTLQARLGIKNGALFLIPGTLSRVGDNTKNSSSSAEGTQPVEWPPPPPPNLSEGFN